MTGHRTGHRAGRLATLAVLWLAALALSQVPANITSTASAQPTTSPTADATGAPSDPDEEGGPRFELTSMTPGVVTPDATLVVSGTLWAGDDAPLPAGSLVQLRLQRSVLSTREEVADWVDPDKTAVGSRLFPEGQQSLATDLAPGASLPVTFTVPAEELNLDDDPDAWGPRGMTVTVRETVDSESLATTRTHMTWFPATEVERRTPVSVLVPLTGTTPDPVTGVTDIAALTELTSPGGRFDAVLQAASVPGVTMALDPSVLEAAPPGDPAPQDPPPRFRPHLRRSRPRPRPRPAPRPTRRTPARPPTPAKPATPAKPNPETQTARRWRSGGSASVRSPPRTTW